MSIKKIPAKAQLRQNVPNPTTGMSFFYTNFETEHDIAEPLRTFQNFGASVVNANGPLDRPYIEIEDSEKYVFNHIPQFDTITINGPDTVDEFTTANYTLTGVLTDGSSLNPTPFSTWSLITGNTAATLNQSGVLTTNYVNSDTAATIQVTTVYREATVVTTKSVTVVNGPVLVNIDIIGPDLIQEGTTGQYTVIGHFNNNTTLNLSAYTSWGITQGNAYATVNSGGLVSNTSVPSNQIVRISATANYRAETVSNTLDITIVNNVELVSITITGDASLIEGDSASYVATGHYSDGSTATITSSVLWSVVEPVLYASISNGNLNTIGVTGSNKTITLSALSQATGISGTKSVTIINTPDDLLYGAVAEAGALNKAKILIDAGDILCYAGTTTTLGNRAKNQPDYMFHAATSLQGDPGDTTSYFKITSQLAGGWTALQSTRDWSDNLHKAGGKFSWVCVMRIDTIIGTNAFPMFATWNNMTTGTGILVSVDQVNQGSSNPNIATRAWRSGGSNALITYAADASESKLTTGHWMFVAGVFGDNVQTFNRYNTDYIPIEKYKTDTLITANTNTIQVPYYSPVGTDAISNFIVFGLAGNNFTSAIIDVGMFGFFDDVLTTAQLNTIYNAVRARYGI